MSAQARDLRRFLGYANRTFWRNPASALFTLAFPLFFLVMFTLLFGNEPTTVSGRRVSGATFTVAGIIVYAVIGACFTNLAIVLTFSRELGFLKRIRATPYSTVTFVLARVLHLVLVSVLLVIICLVFGRVAYDVRVPAASIPALVVTLVVGAAAFAALGLAITAAIPNADAGPAIVNALVLPLLFVSNVFIPFSKAPGWVDVVTQFFPVKPFGAAMHAAVVPPAGGSPWRGGDLLELVAWGTVGLLVAVRLFSWEPRG